MVADAGYLIREATPAEHDTIGALVVRVYGSLGELDDAYAAELRDVATRAAVVPVLAAVEDGTGRVLGTVTFVPGPGPYHEGDFGDSASIRMLAVEADARKRGIGSALVDECVRRARAGGRSRISLHTLSFMTAAQAMYEGLGFTRIQNLDWEFEPGKWLYAYVKDLG
jgi:ribosomal protein S18 acetylase RimI-like enzyme